MHINLNDRNLILYSNNSSLSIIFIPPPNDYTHRNRSLSSSNSSKQRERGSNFFVNGPFVKCSGETGRAGTAAEEETAAPEHEGGEADRNREQYTDQYTHEDHRVFFWPRVVQIQAA